MAFTNNFRIERIYFEKLKSNIDILKSYIEAGATGEALELLKNSVDVDGAILLLYRNLGEAWAELADLIQKTQKDLKDLEEKTESYHDELNERIDEVNNYLMALIRELDARLQAVEQDLATMNRNKFYDLVENNGSYHIEKDGETVSFDDIKTDADFPHDVILRYDTGTSVTELEIREFTDSRIDFYSIGLTDSDKTVKEILVSIADSEAVTYSENTLENPLYTFGTGLSLDSNNELSVDFNSVQGKLTEGTGIDIDSNNEISVDTTVIQAKLIEGFGIDIDSNNEIKVDTAQVQEKLIAGQSITLTPDTTDPTKTVIDAQGGSSYNSSSGIIIDNGKISNDLSSYDQKTVIAKASDTTKKTGSEAEYFSLTWQYDTGDPVDLFTGVDKDKVNYLRVYINLLSEYFNSTALDAIYTLPLNSIQVTLHDIKLTLSYTDENNVTKTNSIFFESISRIMSVVDFGAPLGKVMRGGLPIFQANYPIDSAHNYKAVLACRITMNSLGDKSGGTFQSEMLTIYNNLPALNAYVFLHGKSGMNL